MDYHLPLNVLIESYLNQEGLQSSQVAFSINAQQIHFNENQSIIDYMLSATPYEYYEDLNRDVEIAHKYGLYGNAINNVAIVYSKNPTLLPYLLVI